MSIRPLIEKLEAMEPALRSVDQLLKLGVISRATNSTEVGDWDICTWSHSHDGAFTVGCLKRVRQNDEPFPFHIHGQRLWVLVSRGKVRIEFLKTEAFLGEGEYLVIDPGTPHQIAAASRDALLVFVTIPAETDFKELH